jgi:hypothetical protein
MTKTTPRTTKGYRKSRRPRHPTVMAPEIRRPLPSQMSVRGGKIVCSYSSLPTPAVGQLRCSWMMALHRTTPRKSSDNLSGSTFAYDSNGDTLVSSETDSKAGTTRPRTNCYRGIDLFLLRYPDNPADRGTCRQSGQKGGKLIPESF